MNAFPVLLPRPDIQLVEFFTGSNLGQKVRSSGIWGGKQMEEMLNSRCGIWAGRRGAITSFFTAEEKASTAFMMVVHCVDRSFRLFILYCDTLLLLHVPKQRKQSSSFA